MLIHGSGGNVLSSLAAARARLCENCVNAELPKCYQRTQNRNGQGDNSLPFPAVPQCMTSRIHEPSVFDVNLT